MRSKDLLQDLEQWRNMIDDAIRIIRSAEHMAASGSKPKSASELIERLQHGVQHGPPIHPTPPTLPGPPIEHHRPRPARFVSGGLRDMILKYFATHPNTSLDSYRVAEDLGMKGREDSVGTQLGKCARMGEIVRVAKGVYRSLPTPPSTNGAFRIDPDIPATFTTFSEGNETDDQEAAI